MHKSQSMHRECSTIKSFSLTVIQSGGQTGIQAEQKSQISLSTDIISLIKRRIL